MLIKQKKYNIVKYDVFHNETRLCFQLIGLILVDSIPILEKSRYNWEQSRESAWVKTLLEIKFDRIVDPNE